jgi:hypothetical protein
VVFVHIASFPSRPFGGGEVKPLKDLESPEPGADSNYSGVVFTTSQGRPQALSLSIRTEVQSAT